MATRFGNFKELSQGKKPITADEAYLMLKELGMLGNQFIPGAESLGMLLDGKSPKEAAMALQDWIPGNAAYQNWLNDRPQDWSRNAVDAAVMAVPAARGATKAAGAIERTFGGKLGPRAGFTVDPGYAFANDAQKEATQKLVDGWNRDKKDIVKGALPSKMPESVTYANPKINMISDAPFKFGGLPIRKTYRDPTTGKFITESKAVTQAIMPDDATEAAFVRHIKTDYDNKLKNVRHAIETAGPLGEYRIVNTPRGYKTEYKDINGNWTNRTDRAKARMWNDINKQMPAYSEAIKIPDINWQKTKGPNIVTIFSPEDAKALKSAEMEYDMMDLLGSSPEMMWQADMLPEEISSRKAAAAKRIQELKNKQTMDAIEGLD